MNKLRIERIFRRIGAKTSAGESEGYAVIYPLIDKGDFSEKIRRELGGFDGECFVMLCTAELVENAERGAEISCRGESYALISKHTVSVGEAELYAQCYLKRLI